MGYAVYVHQLRNALVDQMEGLAREVEKAEPDEERVEAEKDQLLREINLESSLIGFGWKP